MILKISLNETERTVQDIKPTIDYLTGLLSDLEMIEPEALAAALTVKMFSGCDRIMLCMGSDRLLIKRVRNSG
jgi:hypothetical protein